MKKEFSSIEVFALVAELQSLTGSRIGKIYHSQKKQLVIELYKTGMGKLFIRYLHPFLWSSNNKPISDNISSFGMFLRKRLEGSFVEKIDQLGSERVIVIELRKKDSQYKLIFELFSKGNIILCSEDKMLGVEERQSWSDRSVKEGEVYSLITKGDVFNNSKKEFIKKLVGSKSNISKALAVELGLGGMYAEEICYRAMIDKKSKVAKLNAEKCADAFEQLIKDKKSTVILKDDEILDVVPYGLKIYKDCEKKEFKTFSEALDSVLSKPKNIKNPYEIKFEQVKKKLELQKEQKEKIFKIIEENKKKAECIYENYEEIKNILEKAKKVERREDLKKLDKVKEVKEKEGVIVVEL